MSKVTNYCKSQNDASVTAKVEVGLCKIEMPS